jgi:large conductance mechanosensitive channel
VSIIKEFKEFAVKGNMIDMAVGIIIGGAFGKIVSSLVNDILMPPIGKLMKNINFTDLFLVLGSGQYESLAQAKAAGAATLNYGTFINIGIEFLITAMAVFIMVKAINKLKRQEAASPTAPSVPPPPSAQEKLLTEIRDLLKNR